jgi:hypothetical protein
VNFRIVPVSKGEVPFVAVSFIKLSYEPLDIFRFFKINVFRKINQQFPIILQSFILQTPLLHLPENLENL